MYHDINYEDNFQIIVECSPLELIDAVDKRINESGRKSVHIEKVIKL